MSIFGDLFGRQKVEFFGVSHSHLQAETHLLLVQQNA